MNADAARIVALAEIAHLLQSTDDQGGRLSRALELVADALPYDRCALLIAHEGKTAVYTAPTPCASADSGALGRELEVLLHEELPFEQRDGRARNRLALPLIASDQEHGIIMLERRSGPPYEESALRILSVVAAQLGAYVAYCQLIEKERANVSTITQANELSKLLVGIVSHDLRNPLAAVINGTAMLQQRVTEPRDAGVLERIKRSANRALRIIHDLLDMTREQQTGTFPVTRVPADVAAILRDVVAESHLTHPSREIRLAGADSEVGASVDVDRVAQAVGNLLANAAEHGVRGKEITVMLSATPESLEISVENEGTIPQHLLPSLFDPFRRGAKEDGDDRRSLGLGLYIVALVAQAHGGRADVKTVDERWTTFTLMFPRNTA